MRLRDFGCAACTEHELVEGRAVNMPKGEKPRQRNMDCNAGTE